MEMNLLEKLEARLTELTKEVTDNFEFDVTCMGCCGRTDGSWRCNSH